MESSISNKRIFITGGAGFIGSKLVHHLIKHGAKEITIFDNLHSQVHGQNAKFENFGPKVQCIKGSVENFEELNKAVYSSDPDIIIHFAAETGTGQSLDQIYRYTNVNVMGTVNLLNTIDNLSNRNRHFLLSSSRSVYGEGPHENNAGIITPALTRDPGKMKAGDFGVYSINGEELKAVGMSHTAYTDPKSVYASTKLMQEHLLLNTSKSKNITPRILRFQNVYGPGQSLRNPYTGVLSIFAALILNDGTLNIFEDGKILRDFVYVDDVVAACLKAMASDRDFHHPIDIGSGNPITILDAAKTLLKHLGYPSDKYFISGDFRDGDIRAAYADIEAANKLLDWEPKVSIEQGLLNLATWSKQQHKIDQ